MITLIRLLVAALAALATLPARGAGVTVVTHGFNGNITDWVIPMLERVPGHPGFRGTNFSCYSLTIRENSSGNLVASRTLLGGTTPLNTDSGEILIKLDWSSLAGIFGASSTAVASAAASALMSATLFPELEGRPLVELPLHLVGHSRGGSVISEMARLLGAQGIWVDQLTLLDPHPVTEFGDAAVRVWQNILFAESYWQMNPNFSCPNGASASGAYNRFLTNLGGGYDCPHSDVHLWYLGTIDHGTPTGNNDEVITQAERATWWTPAEAAGMQAGFLYSRIGRGNRLSTAEPAGPGTGRIRDGMNQRWNFGAGTSANRTALPANSGLWPNVIQLALTSTNQIGAADFITADYSYQSGPSSNQLVSVELFVDADWNPYNSNSVRIGAVGIPNTGTTNVASSTLSGAPPDPVVPGDYNIYARANFGGRTRYLYAPQTVRLLGNAPRIASVQRGTDGQTILHILARSGHRMVLQASGDLQTWTNIATNVVTYRPEIIIDPPPSKTQRFYRAVIVPQ